MTTIPAAESSSVALEDVSVLELSVILENLSFEGLVEPFKKFGVTGRAIDRIGMSWTSLDETKIKRVVAKTFFEDHVVPWQSAGRIPRDLLEIIQPPTTSMKVFNSGTVSVNIYYNTSMRNNCHLG